MVALTFKAAMTAFQTVSIDISTLVVQIAIAIPSNDHVTPSSPLIVHAVNRV